VATRSIHKTALALLVASVGASACPVERAHYTYTGQTLKGHADFIAVKRPAWMPGKGNLAAFHVSFIRPESSETRVFDDWFIYDQGSSGSIKLLESTDRREPSWDLWELPHDSGPLAQAREFIAWGDDYVVSTNVPKPGSTAPSHVFVPGLAESLLKSTGLDSGQGLFKLEHCDE
jgi:hypothetical protein